MLYVGQKNGLYFESCYKFVYLQAAVYGAGCWAQNMSEGKAGVKAGVASVTSGKSEILKLLTML